MAEGTLCGTRRYQRLSLPKGTSMLRAQATLNTHRRGRVPEPSASRNGTGHQLASAYGMPGPLPDDRLDDCQADFSLMLGASLADPDHTAPLGAGHLFIEDKFDQLSGPKFEISAQPEPFLRGIEDQAGEPLRLAVQIDD